MPDINALKRIQLETENVNARLVAVSKTRSVAEIEAVYDQGHRLFGENRVQELVDKFEQCPKDIEWHLIGHLQTNKVKYIAPFVSMIHSIDSARLLEEVNKQAKKADRVIDVLLQVHIAEESTKHGFEADELLDLLNYTNWQSLSNVRICGLMGMATFTEDKNQVKEEFASLKTLFDLLKSFQFKHNKDFKELSMGMSGDYPLALRNGSTLIRVGSTIFGAR